MIIIANASFIINLIINQIHFAYVLHVATLCVRIPIRQSISSIRGKCTTCATPSYRVKFISHTCLVSHQLKLVSSESVLPVGDYK
jgi:hypothetical protein